MYNGVDDAKLMDTLQTFEPQELNGRGNELSTNDGLVLHDGDRGVFTGDIPAPLGARNRGRDTPHGRRTTENDPLRCHHGCTTITSM